MMSADCNFNQSCKDFVNLDPWTLCHLPHMPSKYKKRTVKEILLMRRKHGKMLNCSQDLNSSNQELKSTKCGMLQSDASPHPSVRPASISPSITTQLPPPAPENPYNLPQQMPHPTGFPNPQEQKAATAEVMMTLFQWQIQQEVRKVEGVSPELLVMQDTDGDTFLHIAVAQGKRALVYALASKMAQYGCLDIKEYKGQTALHIAIATNQHLIIQDLLLHGAQVNTRDCWGRSPLHVCAEKGYLWSLQSIWRTLTESVQLIDVEIVNFDGLTPLHMAVLSHNAIFKEIKNLQNPCHYMEMDLSWKKQTCVEIIKTLLNMGASLQAKDRKSGRNCLHMASEEANVELLSIFLSLKASLPVVNVKTFAGNTALHIASSLLNRKTQVEAVKMLMRHGADPGIRNSESELPCQLVPEGPIGEKVWQVLKGKHVHDFMLN
ncbi:NF-kappa-B inhibitor zeta-like isoform 1-T4 [Pholidichthys leucotaenia]